MCANCLQTAEFVTATGVVGAVAAVRAARATLPRLPRFARRVTDDEAEVFQISLQPTVPEREPVTSELPDPVR